MPTTTQNLCYNCFRHIEDPAAPCPYCGFDLAENTEKFPVALRAGTVLSDRYIVGRVLGQGGFGITYLAFDTQLQAKVAVKEYMPGELAARVDGTTVSVFAGTKTDDFTYGAERFQEEARTLAKFIGHPNIAGVSSYFDENNTSYFVMDYIEGVSFKSYIANNGGKVSVDEALNVMIPVLRALTAVHAEGFIHRDVTPDNIYISKDGNVKLLDFGSARYSIGDKSKSLDVILKVGYAPKEQYIRRGRQGPYTDVYSCAACLYAALTGVLPPESLERLDHDELVPVSQAGIDIPDWLDRAILKGLAVQPEDRFQSAAEFLDAIENQTAVEVPAPSAPIQPEKKKPKTALIAGIAAALAVVLGVGIFLGSRGGGEANAPTANNENMVMEDEPNSAPEAPEEPVDDGLPPLREAEVPSITIQGVEYSTELRELDLEDASLSPEDFDQLKYMVNLMDLRVRGDGNFARDLSFAAGLTELRSLDIRAYCDDLDLSPLTGLAELEILRLSSPGDGTGSRAPDFSPLAGLTKLRELEVPTNAENLDPLTGMTELEFLQIWCGPSAQVTYPLTDIGGLAGLTKLREVSLCLGGLEDLEPMRGLTEMKSLSLYTQEVEIPSLEPLSGMTKLESLNLYLDRVDTGLTGLEGLTNLTTVRLLMGMGEQASSISLEPIAGWSKVATLMIQTKSIKDQDLTPLAGLTNLRDLELHTSTNESRIQSLEPLRELTKLQRLSISCLAKGIDLSPVEHVSELDYW